MGYESSKTNDKAIIGVAVFSTLTLIGLIPVFHSVFDSTMGARQAAAYAEGTSPHTMRIGTDGSRTFPEGEALSAAEAADASDDTFRLVPVGDGERANELASQCLASGQRNIAAAMRAVASGQRGRVRPAQNEDTGALTGWNQMENADAAAAATSAIEARRAAQAAAAAAAAAAEAAAAEAGEQ